jgi:hypothetical protein
MQTLQLGKQAHEACILQQKGTSATKIFEAKTRDIDVIAQQPFLYSFLPPSLPFFLPFFLSFFLSFFCLFCVL